MQKTSRAVTVGGAGVVIGGVAGLAVGLGVIAIPGIGPAVAGGPIAFAIGGAVGAAAGGIIGALTAKEVRPLDETEESPEASIPPSGDIGHTTPSGTRVYLDGLELAPRQMRFEDLEHDYRADFRTRNLTGYTYEQLSPAYRFGYDTASDPRFANEDWPAVADYLRRAWEARNPGTWDEVKDAVRYAWQSHKSGHMPG